MLELERRLAVCGCPVATEITGRAIVWDPAIKAWRLILWSQGVTTPMSMAPVQGCPVCLQAVTLENSLPVSKLPHPVPFHLDDLDRQRSQLAYQGVEEEPTDSPRTDFEIYRLPDIKET